MAKQRRQPRLTHLTDRGELHMVDVGQKPVTTRVAVASSRLHTKSAVLDLMLAGKLPKGEALAAARVAGILAAKRTGEWIPLCHPLPIDAVEIEFERTAPGLLEIRSTVRTTARTGVEMEALVAVSAAALTLYDMAKSADKAMTIGPTRLELKTGGKSGTYRRKP